MYDQVTAEFIRRAPALEGLDVEALPKELTRVYLSIVRARIRMATREPLDMPSGDIDWLVRLANTYEAYALLVPGSEHVKPAAFVAGSAHRLLSHIVSNPVPVLSVARVEPQVKAPLLFLLAGMSSDAREAAAAVSPLETMTPVCASLVQAIASLGRGSLLDIAAAQVPRGLETGDSEAIATDLLWRRILEAIHIIARATLGLGNSEETLARSRDMLRSVIADSVDTVALGDEDLLPESTVYSTFAGPHHLATLLLAVSNSLETQSLVLRQVPPGVPDQPWRDFLRRAAETRPYLWRNHAAAFDTGYLSPGNSAVISYPTGAGKFTLAEFKILSTRSTGKPVIFLAPTLALVGQVTRSLRESFPQYDIRNSLVGEGEYAELDDVQLPDVAVMTPERCLTFLGSAPEAFADIGLIVFDECHLLHPRDIADRRSLNAMLVLLGLVRSSPGSDVLLMSAMISNGPELARWVTELTSRVCHALVLDWKPTRQARGCVVYNSEQLSALDGVLVRSRAELASSGRRMDDAPAHVQRQLVADPIGFFCLNQTWSTRETEDYRLVRLLPESAELGTSSWRLTANRNEVAARLASALGAAGVKTLVFSQAPRTAAAISRRCSELLSGRVRQARFTLDERAVRAAAIEELGAASCIYSPDERVAACHHGLLLDSERELSESIFRRAEGVPVLAATPTLAQGMNLPAEAVIIAGDDRWDVETDRVEALKAHELLNAVGRAGRAGHVAQGVVLIVPGVVVGLDEERSQINERWIQLQANVFSKSDQCLEVQDPIEYFLDALQLGSAADEEHVRYFLHRLPSAHDGGSGARDLIASSFGAFKARQRAQAERFQQKVQLAIDALNRVRPEEASVSWIDDVSSITGISSAALSRLHDVLHESGSLPASTTMGWVTWFFGWLRTAPDVVAELLSDRTLELALQRTPAERRAPMRPEEVSDACAKLERATKMWMRGVPLRDLERFLTGRPTTTSKCDKARQFAVKAIPEVAFAIGLGALLHRRCVAHPTPDGNLQLALGTLASCVREGHQQPGELAVRWSMDRVVSRATCRRVFSEIASDVQIDATYSFAELRSAVREQIRLSRVSA